MAEPGALIGIFLILAMVVGAYIGRRYEIKRYNNGVCAHCGAKLRHFDNDSQGGRGYVCDSCKDYIWVSWNIDGLGWL